MLKYAIIGFKSACDLLLLDMLLKIVREKTPIYGSNCFFAENATLIGDVVMGNDCSVWYQAVVRGDVHSIRIGNRVNIQDGAVVHATYQKSPTQIGNNVSVGHNAIVHGCTIHDIVLIGMGALVMDDCVVESNTIIAAGAVVPHGPRVPTGTVFGGVPARKIKEVSQELLEGEIQRIANNYLHYADWFR